VPTLAEVYAKAKYLYEQGPAHHDRKCHFGLVDVEAKERIKNPRKRVVFETDETNASEFHEQKERYIKAAGGNKTLGIHAMILILKEVSSEAIAGIIEQSEWKSILNWRKEPDSKTRGALLAGGYTLELLITASTWKGKMLSQSDESYSSAKAGVATGAERITAGTMARWTTSIAETAWTVAGAKRIYVGLVPNVTESGITESRS
jgi:hypothetical protein